MEEEASPTRRGQGFSATRGAELRGRLRVRRPLGGAGTGMGPVQRTTWVLLDKQEISGSMPLRFISRVISTRDLGLPSHPTNAARFVEEVGAGPPPFSPRKPVHIHR
jgi:hypothetical protein